MINDDLCIHKKRPDKIYESNGIYYFYFNYDGITKDDYEPVYILEEEVKRVYSRYHWRLLTIWTDLVLKDGKPSISFSRAFHTPIAHCNKYNFGNYCDDSIDYLSKAKARLLIIGFKANILPIFFGNTKERIFNDKPLEVTIIVNNDSIEEKYNFAIEDLESAVVIGEKVELPAVIRGKRTWKSFQI